MRDSDFPNENNYGSFGHNRNIHNNNSPGDDYREWTDREYASERPGFNQEHENQRFMEEQRRNQSQAYRPQNYQNHRNNIRTNDYQENRPYDPNYYRYLNRNMGTHQRASYSRGMYAIPGPDPDTGRYMNYGNGETYPHENHDRGLASQFTDEVRSWFGDREAARRRRLDSRDSLGEAWHSNDPDLRQDNYNHDRSRIYDNDRDQNWVRNHNVNNGW